MIKRLLTLLLIAVSSTVFAGPVKVSGVWGWIPTSTQGSYVRAILEESNKIQSKYEFVFENRPGAGASIAARHVLDHKGVAVFANSTAQFIRPYLYPENSYALDDFKPIVVMGISPAALITKGKTLEQLIAQDKINFATAGTGSTIHLMAEALVKEIKQKYPNKDIQMIHFASTNEAFLSVMGGHTDATFEFLGDAKGKALPETTLVGLTGKNKVDGIAPLADMGYKNLVNLQGIFAIYAPASMSDETIKELQKIFLTAEKSDVVQKLYKSDYAVKDSYMTKPGDLSKWYADMSKQFKVYTTGISVK